MLDIKFIRENPEVVQEAAKNKGVDVHINHLLELDNKQQELSLSVQKLHEERNRFAKARNIEEGRKVKRELEEKEANLKKHREELDRLLLEIPNPALNSVSVGDESANKILKKRGELRSFDFTPRDHLELGELLDIIDVKRAAKVSGTRFTYLKNEGVLLEFALIQLAFQKLIKENFIPLLPPMLIKKEMTNGLGYWHGGGNENYYFVRDYEKMEEGKERELDLYLIGTGEHAGVLMHADEIFKKEDLPKKYAIFSSCFRREAGSYGKDTRGILRVHQFDKVEMVAFVKPEDDEKERRNLLSLAEDLMQSLELPYQTVALACGDLGFPSAETIDIETWIPSQNKYRETHSVSTTTDFQARRLNIKYQNGGEKKFVHILNGTAFAIGRTLIAILENYQQKDGSVLIPKVLQIYTGFEKILPKNSKK